MCIVALCNAGLRDSLKQDPLCAHIRWVQGLGGDADACGCQRTTERLQLSSHASYLVCEPCQPHLELLGGAARVGGLGRRFLGCGKFLSSTVRALHASQYRRYTQ